MILHVISRYRSATAAYDPGQVLDLSEAAARHLLADAPGCFAEQLPEPEQTEEPPAEDPAVKAPDAPPVDKMVRAPGRRKRATEADAADEEA